MRAPPSNSRDSFSSLPAGGRYVPPPAVSHDAACRISRGSELSRNRCPLWFSPHPVNSSLTSALRFAHISISPLMRLCHGHRIGRPAKMAQHRCIRLTEALAQRWGHCAVFGHPQAFQTRRAQGRALGALLHPGRPANGRDQPTDRRCRFISTLPAGFPHLSHPPTLNRPSRAESWSSIIWRIRKCNHRPSDEISPIGMGVHWRESAN